MLKISEPSVSEKLWWVVPWSVLFLTFVAGPLWRVRSVKRELKGFEFYPMTQGKIDEHEAWLEGMEELDRERKAEQESE